MLFGNKQSNQRNSIEVASRGCSDRLLGEVVRIGCSAKVVAWRGYLERLLGEVTWRGCLRGCLERLLG